MLRFPRAHPSVSPAAFPSPSSRAPARALLATARMAIQIAELFIAAAITRVGIIGARITAVGIIGAGIIGVGIIGVGISSPAAASFQSGLSVAVQGGHDDRILTGTQASDTVAASAGAFGATRLDWDLGTSGPAGRFSLLLTTAGSAFTSGAHPRDSDLRAEAAFHHWMSTSLFVDLRVLGLRFRRDEARVLDLDMIAPTARVALLPARSWLLAFDLSPAWPRYPGRRPLDPFGRPLLPPRTEQDRSLGVSMTLLRETAGGGYAALETGWDHNRANDPLVEYDGPFIGARAAGGPATLRFSVHLAFAARSYLYDSGFRSAGPGPVALSLRRDHTWRIEAGLEHPLSQRITSFADGSVVWQRSNLQETRYHQTRVSAGLRLALWANRSEDESIWSGGNLEGMARESVSPVISQGTVRFLCRAPGASSVALAGGFNGWDPTRCPMHQIRPDGLWEIDVPLPAGLWRYAFVVDGTWVRPSGAPLYEEDGYGGENGVLEIPPGR